MTQTESIDEALALIKFEIEYKETHGGCPPAVKGTRITGVEEAKQVLSSLIQQARLEAEVEARIDENEFWHGVLEDRLARRLNIDSRHISFDDVAERLDFLQPTEVKALSSKGESNEHN